MSWSTSLLRMKPPCVVKPLHLCSPKAPRSRKRRRDSCFHNLNGYCAQDRTIRVWEVTSGKLLATLVGHQDVVMTCAFSRDGLLVSSSRDKTLKIWDIQTGRELFTLTGHNEAICSCGFSPDGLHIVSASMDKTLKLWDVHTGQPQYTLSGHEGWVLACAFSPDGKRVLSGSAD